MAFKTVNKFKFKPWNKDSHLNLQFKIIIDYKA